MKLLTLALFLLTNPLYAHVSHHTESAPQHSIEHMTIAAVVLIVGYSVFRLIKKIRQR